VLLSMNRKVFFCSVFMMVLTMPLGVLPMIYATGVASVYVDPSAQTVGAVGDSFIVNVNVSGVSDLYGYEFQLLYDPTVMNGTGQPAEGPFLENGGETFFFVLIFSDHYDSTHGMAWVRCTLSGNVSGVSGSGVLATIEFKSLALGSSILLHLSSVELVTGPPSPSYIPNQDFDGTVTVILEFAPALAFLTLIIASLLAVFAGKRATYKSRVPTPSG
jgi:hypothetical protein